MSLFLVIGTKNLRTRVTAGCASFYMPADRCAFVPFSGTADQLARRLGLDPDEPGPRGGRSILHMAALILGAAGAIFTSYWFDGTAP